MTDLLAHRLTPDGTVDDTWSIDDTPRAREIAETATRNYPAHWSVFFGTIPPATCPCCRALCPVQRTLNADGAPVGAPLVLGHRADGADCPGGGSLVLMLGEAAA